MTLLEAADTSVTRRRAHGGNSKTPSNGRAQRLSALGE